MVVILLVSICASAAGFLAISLSKMAMARSSTDGVHEFRLARVEVSLLFFADECGVFQLGFARGDVCHKFLDLGVATFNVT